MSQKWKIMENAIRNAVICTLSNTVICTILTVVLLVTPPPIYSFVPREKRIEATRLCGVAEEHLLKNEYIKAIHMFEKAIALNPGREKYKSQKQKSIAESQNFYYEQGTKALSQKKLGEAKDCFEKAQKFIRHFRSKHKLTPLIEQINKLNEQAETADKSIKAKNYKKALSVYKELLNQWPDNEKFNQQTSQLIKMIEDSEVTRVEKVAKKNYHWHEGIKAAKQLQKLYPHNLKLPMIIKEAQNKLQSHKYIKEAKKYIKTSEYERAFTSCSKGLALFPSYPGGTNLKNTIAKSLKTKTSATIAESMKSYDWPAVIKSINKRLTLDKNNKEYKKQLTEAKEKYACEIVVDLARAEKKENTAYSLIYAIKTLTLDKNNKRALKAYRKQREKISQLNKQILSVSPVKNNSPYKNIEKTFKNIINEKLKCFDKNVVTSSNINNKSRFNIFATIKHGSVQTKKKTTTRTITYEAGNSKVETPEYILAKKEYDEALARLKEAEQDKAKLNSFGRGAANSFSSFRTKMAVVNATKKVNQGRDKLNNTQQYTLKKSKAKYNYPVFIISKTCNLVVELSIYDKAQKKTIIKKIVKKENTISEEEIKAEPDKNIEGSTAKFPADKTMLYSLSKQCTSEFKGKTDKALKELLIKLSPPKAELTAENAFSTLFMVSPSGATFIPAYVLDYLAKKTDLRKADIISVH